MKELQFLGEISAYSMFKSFVIFLFQLEMATSILHRNTSPSQSCYTCTEPLIGYSKCEFRHTLVENTGSFYSS